MYSISHNNIVGIYNHFEDDENCFLVIEYAGGGQVYSKMMGLGGKRFPEKDAACMVYELCLALDYLHKRAIIHRDIKPENLLLSDNSHRPTLKLADFGWSNFEEGGKKRETYCGTVDYLAPEMADRHHKHDRGVDIWCVGVLIFELLTGKSPFSPDQKPGVSSAQAQRDTKKNIITLNYAFPDDFPVFAKDLVKKILTLDPAKRLPIPNILIHPWFKQNGVTENREGSTAIEEPNRINIREPEDEEFKSYVNERIQSSIVPEQEVKFIFQTPEAAKTDTPVKSDQISTTKFSFTHQELANNIRPQSILGNKEITQKYLKKSNTLPIQETNIFSAPKMESSNHNPYTQETSTISNNSNLTANTADTDSRPSQQQRGNESTTSKAGSSNKDLQKLFIILKSKDEEILKLKTRVLQLEYVEKVNSEQQTENFRLRKEIDDLGEREEILIEKVTALEASNVKNF